MNLEIDYREKDMIKICEKELDQLNFTVCNLIIGDFIIKKNDSILFVIERKSVKDLCASIIDNRFQEQRSRLIESIKDPKKIIYIIEDKKESYQGISKNTINSAILNLIFKHKYTVIFTDSKQDTMDNIKLLYTKIKESKLELTETIQPIKIIKKSEKINNNIFINMLCIIPSVSSIIAIKIHEKYNTLSDIILAYTLIENEGDKKIMLSNIIINDKRKVGKAVSEKIYNALMGLRAQTT